MGKIEGLAAVLLAGGLQTRFRSVSASVPKAMMPVGTLRRPNLEILVEYLLKHGISKIIIAAGFLSVAIEENFVSWRKRGVEVVLDDPSVSDTGAVMRDIIWRLIRETKDPVWDVLYWNPDTLVKASPEAMYSLHRRIGFGATLALTSDPSAPNFGAITSHKGVITHFNEDSKSSRMGNAAHAGVGILRIPALLDVFEGNFRSSRKFCLFRDVLPLVVERGAAVYQTGGRFLEWGNPKGFSILENHPEWVEEAYAA